jgi:nicotinate phosphoribosyltransferase
MGVSADAPYVDSVYKLVEAGGRPVLKLSSGKETAPGAKQVWRGADGDVLALRGEPPPASGWAPLLEPVMRRGLPVMPAASLDEMRTRFRTDLDAVPAQARRIVDPSPVAARRTDALATLTSQAREAAILRAGLPR